MEDNLKGNTAVAREGSCDLRKIHAIGNGKVCAYMEGTCIDQIFGPGYSSPVALKLVTVSDSFSDISREEFGLWRYKAMDGSTIVDHMDPYAPIFYREFKVFSPICFVVQAQNTDRLFPIPRSIGIRGLMCVTYEGALVYQYERVDGKQHGYVSGKRRYFGMSWDRNVDYVLTNATAAELTITAHPHGGVEGTIFFAFADTPEKLFHLLANADAGAAGRESHRRNREETERILSRLTEGQKCYADSVLSVYDAIAAQQAEPGGVLAGNRYHLCYIRDNYGVFRGLLPMGAYERARSLMEYYIKVFTDNGCLHNAQGSSESAFHVHENDAAEITGYLVDMIARTYAHMKDADFTHRAEPLATWCILAQHEQLHGGLLPFNGDETYIAGGLLPRTAINDASMEATALYHQSLCQILFMRQTLSNYTGLDFIENDKTTVELAFPEAFLGEKGCVCNCPDDRTVPAFRTGVRFCRHGFGLSFRNANGDYVCADCMDKQLAPLCDTYGNIYTIPSAILSPEFVGSSLIPQPLVHSVAKNILHDLPKQIKIVGYDYGLLLYALRNCEDVDLEDIIDRMFALADEYGVWNEYYTNNAPSGTPCRPWERAINIAALMEVSK